MTETSGRVRFERALAGLFAEHLQPVMEERWPDYGQVMVNHWFGEGPTSLNLPAAPRSTFVGKLAGGWAEISTSLDMLGDSETYLRRHPTVLASIPKDRYLAFHMGAFYSEIYVLRERISAFATVIERAYQKDSVASQIRAQCGAIEKLTNEVLGGLVRVRGRHVHEARFEHEGIGRLRAISFATEVAEEPLKSLMSRFFRQEHRTIRKELVATVKRTNKTLAALVNALAAALADVLKDPVSGAVRYPSHFRMPRPRTK
jgi:hypothetical protein